MNNKLISEYFDTTINVLSNVDQDMVASAIEEIIKAFLQGKKIFTCGNGGSAYAASHYITDWNKMTLVHTGKPFKGYSLCDNIGIITAYANDMSYDEIFAKQLETLGEQGDLLIVISGSGNSPNVISVVKKAKELEITTLGILGFGGGKAAQLVDQAVILNSNDMQICEDFHLMFGHIVMKKLCNLSVVKS